MKDLTSNIPEVVAEVRALFERYEQALIDKDVDVLDATFWNSPRISATTSGMFGVSSVIGLRPAPAPRGSGLRS